ncbi:homoserine dehydrogenase [Clostridium sp. AL.422]|uniref:homoserine dehydrogenase n=1 Tax=Clostridium TaxID=1485 RepID=UPI00293DF31B|nr:MULTISPECIES: homoserine dehydrogenase [unclassified Clostridium]MDV4149300.1 homoserine dehydrogenase [Clostridium sp. AL.422]
MNVGIIGFGGVSKAFINLLIEKEAYLKKRGLELKIKYIIKSNGGVYNTDGINLKDIVRNNYELQSFDFNKDINIGTIIKNKDIDILVELTSTNIDTGEPGLTHIKLALENSINVVTGNKGPILLQYKELKNIANKNNVALEIGCTTGGALPSINVGSFDIAGADILSIEGILNGTSNFILSQMYEEEMDYEEALNKAITLGIAEANYKLDVEGFDTASKILILANVLMDSNLTLDDIEVEGINNFNKDIILKEKYRGNKIKLIGKVYIENNKLKSYVGPEVISSEHPLYFVDNKSKGVCYKTDTLGDISVIGGASGTINAAASILRDIINLKNRVI